MKPRHRRLIFVGIGVCALGLTAGLVLNAFNNNMVFFFSPSEVKAKEAPVNKTFRLGGLVREGSVQREHDGVDVQFVVTDTAEEIPVIYSGILPDLFREGEGVVAQGRLKGGVFYADEVLAKHDETYMPPEVAEALDKARAAKGDGASLVKN